MLRQLNLQRGKTSILLEQKQNHFAIVFSVDRARP